MRPSFTQSLLCALLGFVALASRAEAQQLPRVIIQTELGDIAVDIDIVHAPITAANFLVQWPALIPWSRKRDSSPTE